MKKSILFTLITFLALVLMPAVSMAIPVPPGQQVLAPFISDDPVVNDDAALAEPIGVGPIAVGGGTVEIQVSTGTFTGPVDMYFAINAPSLSPDIFLLTPTGLQSLSTAGLVKWKANVLSANEGLFGIIPASALPPGTYNFFLAVAPADSISTFYLWQTSFTIGVPITTTLDGNQEVPTVTTAGTGTAVMAVNFDTGAVTGLLTFSGLSGPATAAHFHQAAAGTNGPVVIPLTAPAAASGTIAISATLTQDLLAALRNNQLYLNIHTGANPGGEIRGQVIFPPVPVTVDLSGSQEVPPVTTTAGGIANIALDINTGAVNGIVTFSGLSGPAAAAHFHQAPAGTNGSVVIPLTPPVAAAGTISVSAILTPDLLSALVADQLYLNIHTAANPGGEIRGQIFYPIGAPPLMPPFTPPTQMTVNLSGAQEVPPVSTAGSGTASLTIDTSTGSVTGTITFSGLSGPATAAHFHQASAGANGPVLIPLTAPASTAGTINVSVTLTADQLTALTSDQIYINIHTAANPGGEIRGQIDFP